MIELIIETVGAILDLIAALIDSDKQKERK